MTDASSQVVSHADAILPRRAVEVVVAAVEAFTGAVDRIGQIVAEDLNTPIAGRSQGQQSRQQPVRRADNRSHGNK